MMMSAAAWRGVSRDAASFSLWPRYNEMQSLAVRPMALQTTQGTASSSSSLVVLVAAGGRRCAGFRGPVRAPGSRIPPQAATPFAGGFRFGHGAAQNRNTESGGRQCVGRTCRPSQLWPKRPPSLPHLPTTKPATVTRRETGRRAARGGPWQPSAVFTPPPRSWRPLLSGAETVERTCSVRLDSFRLLFLAHTEQRAAVISRIVRQNPPNDFIWLTDQPRVLAHGPAARIWARGSRLDEPPQSILGHQMPEAVSAAVASE